MVFSFLQAKIGSIEFVKFSIFLSLMIGQLFLYCWFGNMIEVQVKLKFFIFLVFLGEWQKSLVKNIQFFQKTSLRNFTSTFGQFYLMLLKIFPETYSMIIWMRILRFLKTYRRCFRGFYNFIVIGNFSNKILVAQTIFALSTNISICRIVQNCETASQEWFLND